MQGLPQLNEYFIHENAAYKKKSTFLLFLEIVNPVSFFCLCCGGTWQRLSLRASKFISVKVSEWGGEERCRPCPAITDGFCGCSQKALPGVLGDSPAAD